VHQQKTKNQEKMNEKIYTAYLSSLGIVPTSAVTASTQTSGTSPNITITVIIRYGTGVSDTTSVSLLNLIDFAYQGSIDFIGERVNQFPERFVSIPKQITGS
jgi:hypothetical protein